MALKKKGNEDLPAFLHTKRHSVPADDAEDKLRELEKNEDLLDIPTFLRTRWRHAGEKADTTIPESKPETSQFLRSTKEREQARIGPEEIRRRLVALRAIEKDASGKNAVCRHCFEPARLVQVGRCVYAKPCGHRQYQGTC